MSAYTHHRPIGAQDTLLPVLRWLRGIFPPRKEPNPDELRILAARRFAHLSEHMKRDLGL
ncbi:MAG: hypothetical protein AAGF74_08955 [Pseudomonadota bacterium]